MSLTISAASGSGTSWCLSSGFLQYPYAAKDDTYSPFDALVSIAVLTFTDKSLLYMELSIFFSATLIPPVIPRHSMLSKLSFTEMKRICSTGSILSRKFPTSRWSRPNLEKSFTIMMLKLPCLASSIVMSNILTQYSKQNSSSLLPLYEL